jgi:hypothetical protein
MRSPRLARFLALGACSCVLFAACSSGSKHTAAPTATTAAGTTGTAVTTTSAGNTTTTNTEVLPTTNSLPCQPLPPPVTPLKSPAPAQPVSLTSVTELGDSCVDHVAFGFRSSSPDPPGYELSYGTPPFTSDGSGAPVPVKGSAFIVVKVSPGYDYELDSGKPTYTGSKRIVPARANHVTEIVQTGDFEGVLSWVIGLDEKRPFSVQATGAPQTELVVTVG